MEKFKHYIVTRFNLGLYRVNPDPDGWFIERMDIFKSVTLPSIRNQTRQDFTWALLLDRETPKNHSDELWNCFAENALYGFNFEFVYIDLPRNWRPKRYGERWSCEIGYSAFNDVMKNNGKRILQTRLDNDDALMPKAVETIRNNLPSRAPYCMDFTCGYAVDSVNKKLYYTKHPMGTPFISLFQSNNYKLKCIYDMIHQKIGKIFPSIELSDRIWIMNLHEKNVSNRLFPWLIQKEISYDSSIPGCI